ncbi:MULTISPECIES: DUF177 domain-containing protein [unclassified Paenibacillus]|uniref:YceD family protein n=1 Tax=unclassified Paenibacillus TaxID=185978 RepID=UPI001C120CA0|nr:MULTISPECIES: DUF177 domain-containing protein [unclassified Paenibacillus]MBU5444217.1 DUF177 domain-containing protein [Paenibacillus sp. MSJ-34]CAH0122103.1 hypothetical protein PAE9249_04644 [Paenibacillus sp. CECT 9249]
MHFHFREIGKGKTAEFHQTIDVNHIIEGRNDITSISPLRVDLQASPAPESVVDVRGELHVRMDLNCSRCLAPLTETYVIPFHEQFKQMENPAEADEDEELIFVSEDQVDIKPYVEETLYMNLPYVPLCGEDCKGLCPTCGQNLNEQACSCSNERIDPRLAGLKDFFKSQK